MVGELGQADLVHRVVDLLVEVVYPELVEVAQDGVLGAAGDEANPVVECLAVVAAEVFAAFFHFDEDDGLPDVIGEAGAAPVFVGLLNAKLGLAADLQQAALAEGLQEAVEKNLCFALLVAGDVLLHPIVEISKAFGAIIVHRRFALRPDGLWGWIPETHERVQQADIRCHE